MADPMKIRATLQGDTVEVRVLMQHEMETGQRKDAAGKTIPAWHIQQLAELVEEGVRIPAFSAATHLPFGDEGLDASGAGT